MTENQLTSDFIKLWNLNSKRVYAFIISLLPRWADADDIFQETCQTALQKFAEQQPVVNFPTWACRIAYLKVLEARKKERHRPLPFSDLFVDTVEKGLFAKSSEHSPRQSSLQDCLQKLSEADRILIEKRYFQDSTAAQLADETGYSIPWVYKTLTRIHQLLLKCLKHSSQEDAEV